MPRTSHALTIVGSLAAMLSVVSPASADPTRTLGPDAQARLDWAKRHVELVCKPLESKGEYDRATRCYNDVTRLVGDLTKTALPSASSYAPAKVAVPRPAAKPAVKVATARPAPARPAKPRVAQRPLTVASADPAVFPTFQPVPVARRCSGIACLQQYTLLGVGF